MSTSEKKRTPQKKSNIKDKKTEGHKIKTRSQVNDFDEPHNKVSKIGKVGKRVLKNQKQPSEGTNNCKENLDETVVEVGEKNEPTTSKNLKKNCDSDLWQPINWQKVLENIRIMRSSAKAPVDTMGCQICHDQNADEKTQRFHKLVALMLSSQTKDETTYQAMIRLKEQTLTPQTITEMKLSVLENILHPVSFYKNKAKYIQETAKILIEKYNSDIPANIKELIALPGVGPKMAHICMSTAWDKITGIGVDVHVHRICNRLGWVNKATKEPEQTRVILEKWLPQDLWSDINYLLVGFGQTICTPTKPKCLECLNNEICPTGVKNLPKKSEQTDNVKVSELLDKVRFKKSKIKS